MTEISEERTGRKRILLDANFLMIPAQYGVDIFSEIERICLFPYELWMPQPVKEELTRLASGQGKEGREARLALALVERKAIPLLGPEEMTPSAGGAKVKNADIFMLRIVRRDRDLVATQDRELRRALRERGIPRIVLRKQRVLEIDW